MRAEAKSLRFLGESPQKLTIPFFQRGYVWKESNWKELIDSLSLDGIRPFLGSIIIKKLDSSNPTEAQVIDGQQRLTTLTILSKAIYDTLTIDHDKLSGTDPFDGDDDDDKYGKHELKSFLFYKVNAADPFKKSKVKIEHSKVDRAAYETIIKENFIEKNLTVCADLNLIDSNSEATSPIFKCYKYYRETLLGMKIEDILNLHNSLYSDENKMIVLITMELDDDNEQSIFDTINRAGVHLSVSDIIKNNLFKQCIELCDSEDERDAIISIYENKWEKMFYMYDNEEEHVWDKVRIFGNQQRTNLDFILYCVAFVKWGKAEDIFSDLANLYKRETQSMDKAELISLIEQINRYACIFKEYVLDLQSSYKSEESPMSFSYNDSVKRLLLILEVFGVQMFYPYVIKLIDEKASIPTSDLEKNLKVLESFVVRRRLSSKGVSDYAIKCDYLIKNGPSELIVELSSDNSGIANDSFLRNMVEIKNENAKLVLFIIELYRRRSDFNDVKSLNYNFTLEHIMPRSWQTNWLNVPLLKEDGTKYVSEDGTEFDLTTEQGQKIRKQHIESLGNMTLLSHSLNSSIRNNTYQKKINGEGDKKPGYRKHTSLYLTNDLVTRFDAGETVWNEARIEARTKELFEFAKVIWPESV